MQLNWKKVEMLPVRCNDQLFNPDGLPISAADSFIYLGAMISNDAGMESELSRRIGMAVTDFKALKKIWSHSDVTLHRKYQLYMSCIVSKLLYGLQTGWFSKNQRRKLDGFHARALRQIVGIRPSFLSRVSNESILSRFGAIKLSSLLLEQQLLLFGKIARMDGENPIRQLIFKESSLQLMQANFKRRRGRPRASWAVELQRHVSSAVQSESSISESILNEKEWRRMVRQYCRCSNARPAGYS